MPRCFLALVALCLSFVSLSAGEEGWLTDLETAKKVAQAEKKDILVDFTGILVYIFALSALLSTLNISAEGTYAWRVVFSRITMS